MLDLKVNYKHKYSNDVAFSFCCEYDESFDCIFNCGSGVRMLRVLKGNSGLSTIWTQMKKPRYLKNQLA